MKVFIKSLISTLVTMVIVSGIVYAAKTLTTVTTQPIGTDDIIGEGWFQQVNDRIPPSWSGVTSGFVLTIAADGDLVWQAPKCGTGTAVTPKTCATPIPTTATIPNLGAISTGTATVVDQPWTYSATPGNCTYQCTGGYSGSGCVSIGTNWCTVDGAISCTFQS